MEHKQIDGHLLAQMIYAGTDHLKRNSKKVDDLNVFPVPDGDTGTNMTLSITSGANELRKNPDKHLGHAAQALSKGLLMGARGNSGVILSQLFRGFGKAVTDTPHINAELFANALFQGVDAAYKAVMKPVEGTILTVAKEAAKAAVEKAKKESNITVVMAEIVRVAKEALAKTPQQLPILKEAGVVDAGGQGLVYVYEGFLATLRGEDLTDYNSEVAMQRDLNLDEIADMMHEHLPAQANMRPEDIEFGYCTEFIIILNKEFRGLFDEGSFRETISKFGDSLLVISDDELVKVHIHAEHPGEVLSFAQRYGHFKTIKIENMREQLAAIHEEVQGKIDGYDELQNKPKQSYAILAVAAGDGLEDIFKSLYVDVIIRGGQTMNPSTEEIVRASEQVNAERIIILPNNSNIILAAEQAKELLQVPTEVIPTKSIPQGIAALISFDPNEELEANKNQMLSALEHVKTGQVTHAVRDSKFGDIDIKEGNFLGLLEKDIVVADDRLEFVAQSLVSSMIDSDAAVLTIIYGEDATEEMANQLKDYVLEHFEDLEVEVHYGGQPVYTYLFSVE